VPRVPTPPTRFLTTVRTGPPSAARKLLTSFATAYFLLVAIGLPVANTREALDAAAQAAPAAAGGGDQVGKGHPPSLNPDDDFSDAIPVSGLVVFAAEITSLDLPNAAPGAIVGQTDAPRPRLVRARADLERGPPSLT
jgi:hypothetical protein